MLVEILIITILFLFIFGVIVFIHEFGHFAAAMITGTKVHEFSIGMGPMIWSKEGKRTKWVVRAIPFGGFCHIEGQEGKVASDDSYSEKNFGQRVLMLAGGVVMNFILAVIVYYILIGGISGFVGTFPKVGEIDFIFGKQSEFEATAASYTEVQEDSPAEEAGMKDNGRIKKIAGISIYSTDALITNIQKYKGEVVEIIVEYDNGGINPTEETYLVTPNEEGKIGIELKREKGYLVEYNGVERIFVGFAHSVNLVQFQLDAIGKLIGQAVSEKNVTPVAKNVSGPIGIFVGVDIFYTIGGLIGILNLIGLLSLGLAVSNLLPFPALDGGYILILILEKLIRKEIDQNILNLINFLGFLSLMVLMVVISVKDLFQFGIIDWVKDIF